MWIIARSLLKIWQLWWPPKIVPRALSTLNCPMSSSSGHSNRALWRIGGDVEGPYYFCFYYYTVFHVFFYCSIMYWFFSFFLWGEGGNQMSCVGPKYMCFMYLFFFFFFQFYHGFFFFFILTPFCRGMLFKDIWMIYS